MGKKKEREAKILEELDASVEAERKEQEARGAFIPEKEERYYCKRCKTLMENGVCSVCGYRIYQPMSEEKRKKIRGIISVVCVGLFLVLFLILKLV